MTGASAKTHGAVQDSFVFVFVWTTVKNSVYEFLDEVHEKEAGAEDEFGQVEIMTGLRQLSVTLQCLHTFTNLRLQMQECRIQQHSSAETQ
jgi:hypothetical protein